MGGIGARLTETTPGLVLARERIVTDDGLVNAAQDFAGHVGDVKSGLAELTALTLQVEADLPMQAS
jgi:hypothetical protein